MFFRALSPPPSLSLSLFRWYSVRQFVLKYYEHTCQCSWVHRLFLLFVAVAAIQLSFVFVSFLQFRRNSFVPAIRTCVKSNLNGIKCWKALRCMFFFYIRIERRKRTKKTTHNNFHNAEGNLFLTNLFSFVLDSEKQTLSQRHCRHWLAKNFFFFCICN